MIYGHYKQVRNATWQLLLDFNIDSMPIDVLKISTASNIKVLKNSEVNILCNNEIGVSITNGSLWYIIYDDKISKQRIRFTIAHELAHIFLGHKLTWQYNIKTINSNKHKFELEANKFAIRLLSPACIIWALNLHTPEEISKLCNISMQAAKIRSERMKVLYKKNKFLISPLEKKLFKQFEKFIKNYKN